ncbi:MAG TPA: GNAT family N-acetyltransferase [Firmicutes bacterium]|nr:GNAT family N-acetyltransferase [Bacillota bacterium]
MAGKQYVRLRPLTQKDLEAMAAWDGDEEIRFLLGLHLEEKERTYRQHCETLLGTPANRLWAIEVTPDRFIGEVELSQITWRTKEAELKICIGDPGFRGQGLGGRAIEAVLAIAFNELKLKRVYLRVYHYNRRAIRCYLRCGFKKEAVLRNRRRFSGQNYDVYLMYIDRDTYTRKTGGQEMAGRHSTSNWLTSLPGGGYNR